MDMSDKLVAEATDELERDREQLRAQSDRDGGAVGGHSVSSVGHRLKLMFGATAAASAVLGMLAVGFGIGLITAAAYLISRAAEQPPILSLTVTIVVVRFLGLARPLEDLAAPGTAATIAPRSPSASASR